MNHYCLPPEEVIEVNRQLIANDFNVLDRGKLEGALAAPVQTFGRRVVLPTIWLETSCRALIIAVCMWDNGPHAHSSH